MHENYVLNVEWYVLHMNPQNQSIFEDEIRGFESDHIMSNLVKKLKSEKRSSNVHTLREFNPSTYEVVG
jgi:hypothetical protein